MVLIAGLVLVGVTVVGISLPRTSSSATNVLQPVPTFSFAVQGNAPVALFVGDSYTAGTGLLRETATLERWASISSREFGWIDRNVAQGGTGYVGTGTGCGLPSCQNYLQVIDGYQEKPDPDIVIISGGRNDTWTPGFQDAVTSVLQLALAKWPEAVVVVTSPLWDDDALSPEIQQIIDSVRAAVAAVPGVQYLEWGQPLVGHPEFIVPDGIHPNVAGYAALATSFIEAWRSTIVVPEGTREPLL